MLTAQQAQFAMTIGDLKSALRRKAEVSDSDDDILPSPGRPYNRKRKARYTREPGPSGIDGPPAWRRKIEHGGYSRSVISLNPPRFDADGDIIEEDDAEEDSEEELSPNEDNPYAEIKLEHLLAPLTSAAALPDHPTMSEAYTSKHLTNLTEESERLMRREHVALWAAKNILQRIRGDVDWVPCGEIGTAYDQLFLESTGGDTSRAYTSQQNGTRTGSLAHTENGQGASHTAGTGRSLSPASGAIAQNGAQHSKAGTGAEINGKSVVASESSLGEVEMIDHQTQQSNGTPIVVSAVNGVGHKNGETLLNGSVARGGVESNTNADKTEDQQPEPVLRNSNHPTPTEEEEGDDDSSSQPPAHRMTTRARAQAGTETSSPPTSPNIIPSVHPFYEFPNHILPDLDFGLPPSEAEDTRNCLLLFVQKYEEIVRCSDDLNADLLKANRMRKEVFSWCKAEGHVGEMSDGEDWYDKEEWGLDEDLLKGKDEEEDEPNNVAKKTRQRRRGEEK